MPTQSNDPNRVRDMYVKENTLDIRVALHQKYSTNPYGWAKWVFDQYELKPGMKLLELGCGNGGIWQMDKVPEDIDITLTDFSPLMLDAARKTLDNDARLSYAVVDIQNIPYPDSTFDAVIANHMLYHVPDLEKGLSEVARVLKPGGKFYSTTIGDGSMRELWALYQPFADRIQFSMAKNSPFTLQNGKPQLEAHFAPVERREYEDSLEVKDPADLLAYIKSIQSIPPEIEPEFAAHIRAAFGPTGALHITKQQGMFISSKGDQDQ